MLAVAEPCPGVILVRFTHRAALSVRTFSPFGTSLSRAFRTHKTVGREPAYVSPLGSKVPQSLRARTVARRVRPEWRSLESVVWISSRPRDRKRTKSCSDRPRLLHRRLRFRLRRRLTLLLRCRLVRQKRRLLWVLAAAADAASFRVRRATSSSFDVIFVRRGTMRRRVVF